MPAFSTIPAPELLRDATRLYTGLRDNAEIAADLAGSVPTRDADLLAHARHFYETIAGSAALAAGIRSLGADAVAAALARLDAADAAEDRQTAEAGESQRASAVRQQAEATLRADASELAETATIALAGKPQLREVLGLMERGA